MFLNLNTGVIRKDSTSQFNTVGGTFKLSADGSQLAGVNGNSIVVASIGNGGLSFNTIAAGSSAPTIVGVQNNGTVIFSSTQNLAGNNSSNFNQFFKLDLSSRSFSQLTNFTANPGIALSALSTDGTRISFLSISKITGENTLGRRQLFSLDLTTGELRQRTKYQDTTLSASAAGMILSGDGTRLIGQDLSDSANLLSLDLSSDVSNFDFEAGFGSTGNIIASFKGIYEAIRGLGGNTLTSVVGARIALDRVNSNIQSLNLVRGVIGASQSRLGTASSLISQQRAEVISASSRVSDVDIAQESAEVVRRQILQQTSASLLAQANQLPAMALSLLRF